jgi:hypothetical protein
MSGSEAALELLISKEVRAKLAGTEYIIYVEKRLFGRRDLCSVSKS